MARANSDMFDIPAGNVQPILIVNGNEEYRKSKGESGKKKEGCKRGPLLVWPILGVGSNIFPNAF